ncbi:MAG TPA: efflux RND transporter periplasmic adaptor subunit [Gemmatimonadales bacterium]|nr:efflux RND transporter periplasmic adaptor subunit [Gemmatimonadales bacterium]
MTTPTTTTLLTALLLGAGLTGCGKGEVAEAAAGGPGGGMPPMPVDVDTAHQGRVVDDVRATGRIEAVNAIELRPDEQGRITAILVQEGQAVERGTPLVKIDDEMLKAQAARAEAERDLARQRLARAERLRTDNANAPADYEEAAAAARAAEATLAALQLQVQRTTVRAPFAGVVGRRFVSLGDYVTTASRLRTLQTTDPQRAVIEVPERYAASLRVGQTIDFTVAARPGSTFRATVDFVDPAVQEEGRTILVKGRAPNARGLLRAGMFIEARLAIGSRAGAVIVPEDAIQPLRTANVVWTVVDGKAARRTVQLGTRTAGTVEVLSGVQPGDTVVVGGLERMNEGMPVQPRMGGAAAQQRPDSAQRP